MLPLVLFIIQSAASISNLIFSASCDSGFSTDSDELSFSGDESPSPVVTPQPTESANDQSEAANLDASELPLSRSWTWYYLNNQSKNWDERINKIAEVKTVEDFWKTYGRIKLPTHISVGCDLMFFQRYVLNFFTQKFVTVTVGAWETDPDSKLLLAGVGYKAIFLTEPGPIPNRVSFGPG